MLLRTLGLLEPAPRGPPASISLVSRFTSAAWHDTGRKRERRRGVGVEQNTHDGRAHFSCTQGDADTACLV